MDRGCLKEISTQMDLAIHGAKPAFSDPLHVGRPNIGDRERLLELIGGMLDRRWLSNDGPLVRDFEHRLSEYLGVKNVIAVSNATIGLEIAVRALRLTGEVIVPSYTFIATAHAVYWQGLTPVFADIDPQTHCLDPRSVERMITPRTTGIIGVHLWGRPAPIAALQAISDKRGLKLLFDAAHALEVSHEGRMIGSFGQCEVFSFHATKFLNSFEGGAIATNDDQLAEEMRLMRNFGFAGLDNVVYPGTNGKMVEACAAMGLTSFESIDNIVAQNRRNYYAYAHYINSLPGIKLLDFNESERNNFQYVVVEIGADFPAARDEVISALHAENVLARRYFWPGCHRMKPYRDLFPWADMHLSSTNAVASRVIVLPTGTSVGHEEIEVICRIITVLSSG